jgi:phenylalanyl-tRNA synthetase beta chain
MKISPQWLRDFVDLKVDNRQLADDLTRAGIAVESISGEGEGAVFEMDITTNRPDAMNHYGVARECSAIYDLKLKPIEPKLPATSAAKAASLAESDGPAKAVPSRVVASQSGSSPAVSYAVEAFPIEIQEPELCPRFTARALRGVSI